MLVPILLGLPVSNAAAQIETGSITGFVLDNLGKPIPEATVALMGDKLIGGVHERLTDLSGFFRYDRLPPGTYELTAEREGFKKVIWSGITINAAFTATVKFNLQEGSAAETITVEGTSPVDTKGVVQQAVMDQELFEGVPTGRDPWSVGKNVPSSQVGVYDVGGTQGMQQTNLSAHGSDTNDKTFSIDGLVINWPGGGGGSTMLYYGHGMFQESNYTTSGVPAEVSTGGVYINMVTKEGGNTWKGEMKSYYANESMQSDNSTGDKFAQWNFAGGNPVTKTFDFNVNGGGALMKDKLWLFGAYRNWALDRLTLGAKNPDGSPALDDNAIKNYMGKVNWQIASNHKFHFLYNFNDKQRGHRRNTPPDFVEDRAALRQENPGYATQGNYAGVFGDTVLSVRGGMMKGETRYFYQDEVGPNDIRREDPIFNTATVAAQYKNLQPNYRLSIAADVSRSMTGLGGDHLVKGGFQFGRLYMGNQYWVNGDMYLRFYGGVPTEITIFNTPTENENYINRYGLFVQDSWVIGTKLSLNLGFRFDWDKGGIPEQYSPAGTWIGERSMEAQDILKQARAVWRTGLVYDPFGDGKTAIKASASRYSRQLGLDYIIRVNPFQFSKGNRAWNDLNGDRFPQEDELGPFEGFAGISNRYSDPDGPAWPYSDEFSIGIERELFKSFRVGAIYFYRTNRQQIGYRNVSVPPEAYTRYTVNIPGGAVAGRPSGPGGTTDIYDMDAAYLGLQDLVYDNQDILNTNYNGLEITFRKRMSNRWQVMGGFTFGRNYGGSLSGDLNDPNISEIYPKGTVGDDAKFMSKFSGTYMAPWDITVSGSVLYNNGYPYQSQYSVTRSLFPDLTRSSQTVVLSERGDERFDNVFMMDLRFSRPFSFGGGRVFEPQVELFNITNSNAITRITTFTGARWLRPAEILAPRIIRIGFLLQF